jgi:hypothetical protein
VTRRTIAAVALAVALAASVATVVWTLSGLTAMTYLAVFILATVPGLPLGFRLFGHRHAAGWIAGMLLGYSITTLACWAVTFAGVASNRMMVIAWASASTVALLWALISRDQAQGSQPLVPLPAWTARHSAALLLILQLVPVLTGLPFARIGARDADGNRRYRAYFTADFVWHAALVAELMKHTIPPRNPYLASQPIHYYWGYFLVPAAAGPLTGADVELSLKVNAIATAMLRCPDIHSRQPQQSSSPSSPPASKALRRCSMSSGTVSRSVVCEI